MLSKYVWFIGVKKIKFIRSCDMEEIKATDCIIKVPITSGNIKWRSFALRFCASNHKSIWQPMLPSTKGLSFIFCLIPYTRVMVIFTFPFLHFILWKALCVGKILIYTLYPLEISFWCGSSYGHHHESCIRVEDKSKR